MSEPHFAIDDGDYEAQIIHLLEQVFLKEQSAITELFNLCFTPLLALCRARLGNELQNLDEEVASYVMGNFIRQYQAGVFPTVCDAIGLWGILSYKVHKRVQRVASQNNIRNKRIPTAPVTADGRDPLSNCGGLDRALQQLEDAEELSKFLQWLPENDRELVHMILAGISAVAVAEKLGVTARTICNRLNRIRAKWQKNVPNE